MLADGEPIPSVLVLSHEEQRERLRSACPRADGVAVVAGDPCLDRMLASRPLRETYRQALGVAPHQRLVMVSSTWGGDSLHGTDPHLVHRLAARLPVDTHRVAVALHPNIVHGHSRWQVDVWLADCARAGVLVLSDEDAWRAALVAADVTVGDHGSVTFYSAALGTPVLLAAAPAGAVDPDSPIGRLLATAPRIRAADDPLARIERAIRDHDPAALAPITALATSCPGTSLERLREVVYRMLDLHPPPGPVPARALPLPTTPVPRPRAVLARADGLRATGEYASATVSRFPAVSLRAPDLMPAGTHLVVDVDEPEIGLLDLADVIVHTGPTHPMPWLTETLRALPGCLLAVARENGDHWLLGTAGGALVRLTTDDPVAITALVHAWLTAERPVDRLPRQLRVMAGVEHVADAVVLRAPVTPRPAVPPPRPPAR
ncbi:hypothetical protein SAMN05421810_103207 [Amycolatopsis arida]|uniref:Uncharacterized protein n=1 Tax=Amycolatopsis arida TaxID=587909 RepID=A0A1I5SNM9_9PSEU|nr:hypothetical protein [Amycolatopsis arida]TDX96413.1 hypothetical protein CLV69_103551 [Amycolatopsis arida]SFP72251.1 hypothetical protein SAMN05421810_103207 [Amycolatopsis arida]